MQNLDQISEKTYDGRLKKSKNLSKFEPIRNEKVNILWSIYREKRTYPTLRNSVIVFYVITLIFHKNDIRDPLVNRSYQIYWWHKKKYVFVILNLGIWKLIVMFFSWFVCLTVGKLRVTWRPVSACEGAVVPSCARAKGDAHFYLQKR